MAPSKLMDSPSKRVPYAKRANTNKIHPALNPSVEMPSFVVPTKFIGHFNELKINSLHRIVDLRRIEIIRRHVLNNPHTNIKIPPHVIGGNVNWHLTLHAIKFYSLLPTKDQQVELAKAAMGLHPPCGSLDAKKYFFLKFITLIDLLKWISMVPITLSNSRRLPRNGLFRDHIPVN